MRKNKLVLILAVVALLLFGALIFLCLGLDSVQNAQPQTTQPSTTQMPATQPSETAEPEKVLAPDFTVYNLEGEPVKLSDFRGKPVILNFWASWCGPCKSEMPDFDEAYGKYGEDIYFLIVNLTDGTRETVTTASDFITQSGYRFPVYYDTDIDAATTYGVSSIPTTYFIDADGYAVAYGTGAMNMETLEKGIGLIWSE